MHSDGDDPRTAKEPITPARDPASIDRDGLVGVGELLTPRWPRLPSEEEDLLPGWGDGNEHETTVMENRSTTSDNDIDRDSPWTIEAVDAEQDDFEVSGLFFMHSSAITQLIASDFWRA